MKLIQFALEDRGTDIKFPTKPDAVALLPTSHDCEDEEYVDGIAISPATVYVAPIGTFSSTHGQLFVFISGVTAVLIGTH